MADMAIPPPLNDIPIIPPIIVGPTAFAAIQPKDSITNSEKKDSPLLDSNTPILPPPGGSMFEATSGASKTAAAIRDLQQDFNASYQEQKQKSIELGVQITNIGVQKITSNIAENQADIASKQAELKAAKDKRDLDFGMGVAEGAASLAAGAASFGNSYNQLSKLKGSKSGGDLNAEQPKSSAKSSGEVTFEKDSTNSTSVSSTTKKSADIEIDDNAEKIAGQQANAINQPSKSTKKEGTADKQEDSSSTNRSATKAELDADQKQRAAERMNELQDRMVSQGINAIQGTVKGGLEATKAQVGGDIEVDKQKKQLEEQQKKNDANIAQQQAQLSSETLQKIADSFSQSADKTLEVLDSMNNTSSQVMQGQNERQRGIMGG